MGRRTANTRVENITETREWKVLEEYHEAGGSGLTANALCYLTKQDWKAVRHNLTRFIGASQFNVLYCNTVNAPVFYIVINNIDVDSNTLVRTAEHLLRASDELIRKYPPQKYHGAVKNKGQKELTFSFITEEYYDEDETNWCGDPSCCPRPKNMRQENKKREANIRKANRELVRELRAAWRVS